MQPKPSTGLEIGVYAVTLNALCNLIKLALFSPEQQCIRQKLGVSSNNTAHIGTHCKSRSNQSELAFR